MTWQSVWWRTMFWKEPREAQLVSVVGSAPPEEVKWQKHADCLLIDRGNRCWKSGTTLNTCTHVELVVFDLRFVTLTLICLQTCHLFENTPSNVHYFHGGILLASVKLTRLTDYRGKFDCRLVLHLLPLVTSWKTLKEMAECKLVRTVRPAAAGTSRGTEWVTKPLSGLKFRTCIRDVETKHCARTSVQISLK